MGGQRWILVYTYLPSAARSIPSMHASLWHTSLLRCISDRAGFNSYAELHSNTAAADVVGGRELRLLGSELLQCWEIYAVLKAANEVGKKVALSPYCNMSYSVVTTQQTSPRIGIHFP